MPIKIRIVTVGSMASNCYIVHDERNKEAIIVDPGAEGERLTGLIRGDNLVLKYIVNTHAHPDHTGANAVIKSAFRDAHLCIHGEDAPFLTDKHTIMSLFFGSEYGSPPADVMLNEGNFIEISSLKLKVIHTPGHTPGGICLLGDGFIFTGDTLFMESVGRTDLPGGDTGRLMNAIRNKILVLGRDTVVYPGHGEKTTIGHEIDANPFLSGAI